MALLKFAKEKIMYVIERFWVTNLENLLWIVDIMPSTCGFSIAHNKFKKYFWIMHLSLTFYIYGVGLLTYLIWYSVSIEDYIKNYFTWNVSIITMNITHWWIMKWPLIQRCLAKVRRNDEFAKRPDYLRSKYNRYLTFTKRMVILFYFLNFFNGGSNYFPHKLRLDLEFAMVPCVGMEPLTSSPNREICSVMIFAQEVFIVVVIINYQAFLILLIDHTAATFHLLADEIMIFNTNDLNVKKQLPYYIKRHILILDIIKDLKSLYTAPIGVNFASNAVCMAMFFYLPLADCVRFLPVAMYCFEVFFLYCFLGQKLVDGAEAFERAVYSCGWEKFGWRERKMVYLMMMIAQQKVELLAADIVPVNYYTFATTLQGMFKFVTVVKL